MLLELKNIGKKYDAPSGDEPVTVLESISLQVKQGETLAVVGPSGSGKSTLLNIMGALDKPSSGTVNFDGKNPADMNERALANFRNTDIGFIFQLHHLLPQCTVLENVLIPSIPRNREQNKTEVYDRAMTLLENVGLEKRADYFPALLSGGERQRVAVARALINRPQILLADEPTGSLDQTSAEHLGQLLLRLNTSENVTLIVVTHSMDLAKKMDRVCRLHNGSLEPHTQHVSD